MGKKVSARKLAPLLLPAVLSATLAMTGCQRLVAGATRGGLPGQSSQANVNPPVVQVCKPGTSSDMGAEIRACIAALPATGGTVDARAFTGSQTSATNPFAGNSKPVELQLGPVTITVSAPWAPNANSSILGAGNGSTNFVAANGLDSDLMIVLTADNVVLKGLSIDVSHDNQDNWDIGCLRVDGSKNVRLDQLGCTGGPGWGIFARNASDGLVLQDLVVNDSGNHARNWPGIWIRTCDNVQLTNIQILNARGIGIRFDGLPTPTVVPPFYHLTVNGLTVHNAGWIGVSISNCLQCSLTNVYVDHSGQGGPGGSGIDIAMCIGLSLSHFSMTYNNWSGIANDSSAYTSISDGISAFNGNDGLGTANTWGSADHGTITNFVTTNNARHGIELNSVVDWTLDRILAKDNNQGNLHGNGVQLGGGTSTFYFGCLAAIDEQPKSTQNSGLWGGQASNVTVDGYTMHGNLQGNTPQLQANSGNSVIDAPDTMAACTPLITGK